MPAEGQPAPATPDELAAIYLRARDVPCPGCGYNRRGGVTAKCPECDVMVHLSDKGTNGWLSLSRRRTMIGAWSLFLFCSIYWLAYCVSIWEAIDIIAVDIRPWNQWWYILQVTVYAPFVVCLPPAAWQLIRLAVLRSAAASSPDERGVAFYRAFRWCIIAIGPWTLFMIGDIVWRLIP